MKMVVLINLLCSSLLPPVTAGTGPVRPDTTLPKTARWRPVQAILPGFSLDTSLTSLTKPDPAVYQVVPAWLQAKAAGRPVYVIDGKTATASQLKGLQANMVESVQVIEGNRAAALYGSVAREGVVAITTKAALLPRKN